MPRTVFLEDLCKGCGLCVNACPKQILVFADHLNHKGFHPAASSDQSKCTGCAICARTCPDVAIEVYTEDQAER